MDELNTNVVSFRHKVFNGAVFPSPVRDWEMQHVTKYKTLSPVVKTIPQPVPEEAMANDKARQTLDVLINPDIKRVMAEFAHEIIQPLTAIALLADGAMKRGGTDHDERQALLNALKIIFKQAGRAVEIINAHKRMATERKFDLNPESISTIIYDAIEFVEILAKESGVTLTASLDKNNAIVSCDRLLIGQVLANLIKNGIEAVRDNSNKPKEVKVASAVEGDYVVLTVSDNGMGMCAGDANLLFKPFHSSKETGMGLGLAISQKIIKAHNSCIFVKSTMGAGSKFYFKLNIIKE